MIKTFLLSIGFLAMLVVGSSVPNWQLKDAIILDSNTIQTADGNVWGYDTTLPVGSAVKIWFNLCDTPQIEDDIIVAVF